MSARRKRSKGIEDAVVFLSHAKERLKFKGNEELLWSLNQLEETSTTTGLSPEHITALVDVAASGIQVEAVNKKIIKCLIPATVVPESAVLKVISWLCTRKPSLSVQCLLLRWVLLVYEHIDKLDNVHNLYGILFHFLHYRTLMPYICHLLYLLTRKEDVKLFRVRQLIQYQRDMGNQAYLTGLLSIYRHYYPSLVHVVIPRTHKIDSTLGSLWKQFGEYCLRSLYCVYSYTFRENSMSVYPADRQWSALMRKVKDSIRVPAEPDMSWESALRERLYPSGNSVDLVPSRKRRKLDSIPVIHSLTTKSNHKKDSLEHLLGLSKVPFVQIKTFKDVLDHIDAIEFPSQIGAVLRSPTLQHLLSYTKDPIATTRFHFWISETLQEVLNNKRERDKGRTKEFLQALLQVSDFIQEGIPAVDIVLTTYLKHWNGLDHVPLILKLLTRCRMYSFELFEESVLEPLRKLFFMSSVFFKCQVVVCLTNLLHNYASNEWPRYQDVGSSNGAAGEKSCICLFSRSFNDFDAVDVFVKIITYVSRMLLVATVNHKHHAILESCILDFLDIVCSLHRSHDIPFVVLAEPRLLERLLISPNPVTVGRVCSVICGYKTNFSSMKLQQRTGQIEVFHLEGPRMVSSCNQLIMDFCNTLWRGKAFSTKDKDSVFFFDPIAIDKSLEEEDLAESLSIYLHQAFLGFAVKFIEKEKLVPKYELPEIKLYRTEYLQFLEDHHLDSVAKFISVFIRRRTLGSTQHSGIATQLTGISQNQSHSEFNQSY